MSRKNWEKRITVDRRIVRLLSASTYEDFPGAIREMVSNAYDADATKIDIRIDLKKDEIVATDNGNGMTPDEFDFFLRIAGQQRGKQISPEFNRRRIGQFGVGFMAIFPFGTNITVISTARRSDVKLEAIIPTEQFFLKGQEGLAIDVDSIRIPGYEVSHRRYLQDHSTTIKVSGLTNMARRYFIGREIGKGRNIQSTFRGWPPADQLMWTLSEDLPLDYPIGSEYREEFSDLGPSGIEVSLNGKRLLRNVHGSYILENETWEYNRVRCRYVIATEWKSIMPYEGRYLKLRFRNVGIGPRTSFGLGIEGRAYSRLHWLTGEVHIIEGFENLLTVDRKRFLESPEYDEFYKYFRSRIAYFANYVESVSEADRDIKRQLSGSRFAEVGARKEIIARNIKTLTAKGFKVLSRPKSRVPNRSKPVKVDFARKVVEVIKDHPEFSDSITIGIEKYPVRYNEWDVYKERFPAVMRAKDGIIEINKNYPLFNSRRYGEVFKKVLVLAFVLSEKAKSPKALFLRICKELQEEFDDLS